MEYLTLNNGVPMPLIGFGTFMLGGETCTEAVTAAIESGYRMIDTAGGQGSLARRRPTATRRKWAKASVGAALTAGNCFSSQR